MPEFPGCPDRGLQHGADLFGLKFVAWPSDYLLFASNRWSLIPEHSATYTRVLGTLQWYAPEEFTRNQVLISDRRSQRSRTYLRSE